MKSIYDNPDERASKVERVFDEGRKFENIYHNLMELANNTGAFLRRSEERVEVKFPGKLSRDQLTEETTFEALSVLEGQLRIFKNISDKYGPFPEVWEGVRGHLDNIYQRIRSYEAAHDVEEGFYEQLARYGESAGAQTQ
ncbi:MAG: hypothetical protein ABIF88_03885 [archaeon]